MGEIEERERGGGRAGRRERGVMGEARSDAEKHTYTDMGLLNKVAKLADQ